MHRVCPWLVLTLTLTGTFALGCETSVEAPLPAPVPLRCGPDPLAGLEVVARGAIGLRDVGPCGDVVFQTFVSGVSTQTLLTPGREPVSMTGQPRGFSPAGDRLAINGATGQVYDTHSGVAIDLFEGFGNVLFLRDLAEPPGVYAVGCGEQEVRVVTPGGEVETLATDVVSCPAIASHAPILLYQNGTGGLHRLDVTTGDSLALTDILYSDGTTTWPGSGRNDLLVLSSDGKVVLHHQRSWGGGREWATLTRTTDGEVLGAIPNANVRLETTTIPGGHVMAITTGAHLWVLDRDYAFHAYEGLVAGPLVADRQMLVWSDRAHDLFVFEPGTGFRSEPILVVESEEGRSVQVPRVLASPGGLFAVVDARRSCGLEQCRTALLHDVRAGTSSVLFDGEGDVSTRLVTDDGVVVMEGTFRRVAAGTYERDIRVYGPDGARIATFDDRSLGQVEHRDDVVFIQSFDVMFGAPRLDRLDAGTGEVTRVADGLERYRLAGERLYVLSGADMAGVSELTATPIR